MMKFQKLIPVALLFLLSIGTLAAQTSLPDAHNDSCWSSLSALRACQLQVQQEAEQHAQNCTSYPEYQCNNYYQPPLKNSAKTAKAKAQSTASTPAATATSTSGSTSDAGMAANNAN